MSTTDLARLQGLAAAEAHRLGVQGDEIFPEERRAHEDEAAASTGGDKEGGEEGQATSYGVNLSHVSASAAAVKASEDNLKHLAEDHHRWNKVSFDFGTVSKLIRFKRKVLHPTTTPQLLGTYPPTHAS